MNELTETRPTGGADNGYYAETVSDRKIGASPFLRSYRNGDDTVRSVSVQGCFTRDLKGTPKTDAVYVSRGGPAFISVEAKAEKLTEDGQRTKTEASFFLDPQDAKILRDQITAALRRARREGHDV